MCLGAPDAATREAVLQQGTAALALGPGVTPRAIAAETSGLSVAQIVRICNAAALAALQDAMMTGAQEDGGAPGMSPMLADMLGLPVPAPVPVAGSTSSGGAGARPALVQLRHFRQAIEEV